MSRIVAVRTRRVTRRLHSTFRTALRATDTVESVLVEVEDADGVVGVGEGPAATRMTGETLAGIETCVHTSLAPLLDGAAVADLDELSARVSQALPGNGCARMAVDVALHDLVARGRGVPLVELLDGSHRVVPTDVSLVDPEPDALAESARARLAEGFGAFKLKVGSDPSADVARVSAVRAAVGPDAVLRIDANQGWTVDQAVDLIRRLEDAGAGVELVEQPVAAEDLTGLARVSAAVATPVMADESIFDLPALDRVLQHRAGSMVNVKLAKAGGLAPARELLLRAQAEGLGTMVGSMMETGVGVAAAAALASAVGTSVVPDLDAAWWLADEPGPVAYDAGTVLLPDEPGLGAVPA